MDALEFLRERQRMCDTQLNSGESCKGCSLDEIIDRGDVCSVWCFRNPEKAIEVVEQWSEEHPSKTRQSVFLEQWPNAELDCEGDIAIEPCTIDMTMYSKENGCFTLDADCEKCRREFWRQEVE